MTIKSLDAYFDGSPIEYEIIEVKSMHGPWYPSIFIRRVKWTVK